MKVIIFISFGILIFIFLYKFVFSRFKLPKIGAITLFTGGVKTGKSGVSLYFAIREFKKARRSWKFRCFLIDFLNVFRKIKLEKPEEPLLYSNIPLAKIDYCPITREHFLRQVRFNFKSVVFIDEASLVADSMLIKDNVVNSNLLLFFKLFGHMTHGGKCIINSHCISDLHYSIKRCTSDYFYIHSLIKLPFISIANCREERYSEDGTDVNVFNEDVEKSTLKVVLFNSIFKYYDCFTFSSFTDRLACVNNKKFITDYKFLKSKTIPSFRADFYNLGVNDNEKENVK